MQMLIFSKYGGECYHLLTIDVKDCLESGIFLNVVGFKQHRDATSCCTYMELGLVPPGISSKQQQRDHVLWYY